MALDFDSLARELSSLTHSSVTDRQRLFKRLCPAILRQLQQDRGPTGPFHFWGRCSNFDEIAQQTIVAPAVLEVMSNVAQWPMSTTTPHAGIQHTYGYLFSTIETPFGKKRDRWVDETLEQAFALPADTLGPIPPHGTLLANATWLAGHIAFQKDPRLNRLKRVLRSRVAPSLQRLALTQLRCLRLTEEIRFSTRNGAKHRLELRTDLVSLPLNNDNYAGPPLLLVYSIRDSRQNYPQLVTLFTVNNSFREAIEERARVRRRSDIRLRYNASVAGIANSLYTGQCRLSGRLRD